jgi:hypothetical protein
MLEFKETMDPDSVEVIVDGIWRAHIRRHDGRPPRLVLAGVDTAFSLVELGQITAKLTAFASQT